MERRKVFGFVVLLLALFIAPLAFSLGLVNTLELPFLSDVVTPLSSSSTVFVDPSYIMNETFQAGSKFTVHVNVSDISDLFTWHVKMSWNNTVLNVGNVTYGEFLAGTTSPYGASSSLEDVIGVFNDAGYAWVAESVLGEYPGVSGDGCLASIEFLVMGYGSTDLNISLTGPLETGLLDSAGGDITFTTVDGYFSNKILGDVNGDGIVDGADFSRMGKAYRAGLGDPNWDEGCDVNRDGIVDGADFSIAGKNYRRSI